ncbi:DUF2283 domain-containing protein [Pseudothauera nasutitermitis]|uniref:DUF2283 domain-containing protein n=1 Tax=Pseudothauera nasutitermitis TaxID=2565930 RepID=A0A4S4AUG6_9RHOO|nr:DUF2283 domain-containing protein [Pseudothauera nasutitermitis]THF63597.1 DUF2283 domain-containing protein [Pseudothauera nasutitermitis]
MKLEFDPIADCAYVGISEKEVASTREIEPGIIADYDESGTLVGIEILSVSKRAQNDLAKKAA